MPNVADRYEGLLCDLETAEEMVNEPSWPNLLNANECRMFGRIALAVRPLLDALNEAHAELEVAQHRIAEARDRVAGVLEQVLPYAASYELRGVLELLATAPGGGRDGGG